MRNSTASLYFLHQKGIVMKLIIPLIIFFAFINNAHAQLKWIKYSGSIPANAVNGGQEPGRTLFVCRGAFNGGIHPGKLVDGRCNIGWGGGEHQLSSFEILAGSSDMKWVDV